MHKVIEVRITRVLDGDTLVADHAGLPIVIRLIGIDAPETGKKPYGTKSKKGAQTAKEFLFNQVSRAGDNVFLELDNEKLDRYNRVLAYVYVRDGLMLNALLLKQGLAVKHTIAPNIKYRKFFAGLQVHAQTAKLGVWGNNDLP